MDGVLSRLKNLDAYPKVNEDFFQRTLSGGIITIASSILMLCLFISEFSEPPPLMAVSIASIQCHHWRIRCFITQKRRPLMPSRVVQACS